MLSYLPSTPISKDFLLVLARHSPSVVDYRTLRSEAQELTRWHVHHIRQALKPDAQRPTMVINVRGNGYRLVVD
jgi:DNA-binding response OmpR family regulator